LKIKGIIILSILFLIPTLSCDKKGDLINLHFYETGCANPWSVSHNDPDYIDKVKGYLEQQKINIVDISITNDGPISGCFSCFCTTGRTVNITTEEEYKAKALTLGFFQ
jgi:hypothetical protein